MRNQLTAAALFPLYVNHRVARASDESGGRRRVAAAQTRRADHHHRQQRPAVGRPQRLAPQCGECVEGCKTMASRRSPWRSPGASWTNVQHTHDSKQKLVEKYDVSSTGTGGGGGEYPLQDGFGWTNGVTLKMLDLICPQEKPLRCAASLPVRRQRSSPAGQTCCGARG